MKNAVFLLLAGRHRRVKHVENCKKKCLNVAQKGKNAQILLRSQESAQECWKVKKVLQIRKSAPGWRGCKIACKRGLFFQCRIQTLRLGGGGRTSRARHGGGGVSKNVFPAFRASAWSINKEMGGGGPGPLPWIRHCLLPHLHVNRP